MRIFARWALLLCLASAAPAQHALRGGGAIGVAADPTGRFAAVSHAGGVVELVDLLARTPVRSVRLPVGQSLTHPAFTADGARVSGFDARHVHAWELASGTLTSTPLEPGGDDRVMAATPDLRWALTSGHSSLDRVWMDLFDGRSGEPVKQVRSGLRSTTFKFGEHAIENLLDATVNNCEPFSTYHPVVIQAAAFSPDARLLATSIEGRVRLWSVPRLKRVASVTGAQDGGGMAFARDGSILAAALGSELAIIDGHSGARLARVPLDAVAQAVAVRGDGQEVALISGSQLSVRAAPDWNARFTVRLDGFASDVAFAGAPHRVLVANGRYGLEIRDPRDGRIIDRLPTTSRQPTH